MSPGELIDTIKATGGVLALEGDEIVYRLPKEIAHLVGELRERKQEVIELLKARGGRIATFPHCPACASYAMYREHDRGQYECLTCGRTGIEEHEARRLQ